MTQTLHAQLAEVVGEVVAADRAAFADLVKMGQAPEATSLELTAKMTLALEAYQRAERAAGTTPARALIMNAHGSLEAGDAEGVSNWLALAVLSLDFDAKSGPYAAPVHRPRLFLDCDGVLADFNAGAAKLFDMPPRAFETEHGQDKFWELIYGHGSFFSDLPLMSDAMDLYGAVKHLKPSILTGCAAKRPLVRAQKAAWTVEHFPEAAVTMCRSAEKAHFCRPGDVLIDDWDRYAQNWRDAGGVFIHHTSAAESLAQLDLIYPGLRSLAA